MSGAASASRSWYVLRVSPRGMMQVRSGRTVGTRYVRRAVDLLERMGMRPFLPVGARWQLRSRYSRSKDMHRVTRPLMPGYLLIDPDEPPGGVNWYAIMELPFVLGVVCADGVPVRVSAGTGACGCGHGAGPRGFGFVIAAHREAPDAAEMHMPTNRTYAPGDRVEFVDTDAWEGQDLRVVSVDGARVTLEVSLLGSRVEVEAEARRVARVA